jgi:hypothetical protein
MVLLLRLLPLRHCPTQQQTQHSMVVGLGLAGAQAASQQQLQRLLLLQLSLPVQLVLLLGSARSQAVPVQAA